VISHPGAPSFSYVARERLHAMSTLFSPFRLRGVEFKNRIFMSPMCQYSSDDGLPTDWHFVHLGSHAAGGVALVMVEATAVSPDGRISPWDSGIWSDKHTEAFKRIAAFIEQQGAVPGIQLAHAGRKASIDVPWRGDKPLSAGEGGWQPIAPSPIAFDTDSPVPREMTQKDMDMVAAQFTAAAQRSIDAGFRVIELHMAHGYLLHEFLSPLSNKRTDAYGGSLVNRFRLPLRVATAVREKLPEDMPLFVRISCTDWVDDGWDISQSVEFSRSLKNIGIDLIDCSSGALVPYAKIPAGPGFQTPFAAEIRAKAGMPTGAVGMITDAVQAEHILITGQADAVILARELLRDPNWPLHAARRLHTDVAWPLQYERAKPR
jgi:2,4-dienoyl-CoA reductase-like NADH-dependent reductase (Old Yellow Enzyme family)